MSTAASLVRDARLGAGLTQRDLAARAKVPQASIARIEGGMTQPRVDTLERLLRACGVALTTEPLDHGIDIGLIRARLAMSPLERHRSGLAAARALIRFRRAPLRRRSAPP